MVANLVGAGRWNERGQSFDELLGLEDDRGRSIAPAALEPVQEPSVGEPRQPLGGQRRAGDVPGPPLQALAVARGNRDVRMQTQLADLCAAVLPGPVEVFGVDPVAEA